MSEIYTILKSVICSKSLIMDLHYLQRKMNRIYYYIIKLNIKGKGMKYTKHHRHISLSLLFIFNQDKLVLFNTIKGLQCSLNASFRI